MSSFTLMSSFTYITLIISDNFHVFFCTRVFFFTHFTPIIIGNFYSFFYTDVFFYPLYIYNYRQFSWVLLHTLQFSWLLSHTLHFPPITVGLFQEHQNRQPPVQTNGGCHHKLSHYHHKLPSTWTSLNLSSLICFWQKANKIVYFFNLKCQLP